MAANPYIAGAGDDLPPGREAARRDRDQMGKIIKKDYPIREEVVSREEAEKRIEEIGERFKLEILQGIRDDTITIYHIGEEWWDLCAGPHVSHFWR